jgi:SNF2 family DNA or RNA helicase
MMALIEAFLRTRQVMTWPQMYFDGISKKEENANVEFPKWTGRSKKLDSLMSFIAEHPKEKSLVFCQFIGEMNEIHRRLQEQNITTFRIDGSVDKDVRETQIKDFRASTTGAVFIIQIKSGGVGLNLQDATRVYITSPSWNPATELQAIGRAHRTGQTQKVFIKRLIYGPVEDTPSVEQSILELQDRKTRICAEVLNDQRIIEQMPKKKKNVTFYDLKKIFKV